MKKVLALLALLPLSAISADWVEIERTKEKAVFIDKESIKYSNAQHTEREAWVKLLHLRDGEYEKDDYTLSFNEFNCEFGAVKFNEILLFSSGGALRTKTNLSADGWHRIPGESNYAYIIETACSYPEPEHYNPSQSSNQAPDFKRDVLKALQRDMSVGGAVVSSVGAISKESPTDFNADFDWTVDGKNYSCSGSVEADSTGRVVRATIPYICYRQYMDQ
nr:surface-adhesin E family protein [uncultured Pseudoxanthomonas sp.]